MALQRCRECDSLVSTEARVCLHCGVPEPTRESAGRANPDTRAEPVAEVSPPIDAEPTAWRYLQADRQHGPHTRGELAELLASGAISPETRVKSDSMRYWMPVKMVPELQGGGSAAAGGPSHPPRAPAAPRGTRHAFPPDSTSAASSSATERERSARTAAGVGYALQAAGFLTVVSLLAAVVIAYLKRDDVEGSWLHSHFQWQIRTFWYLALWVVGALFLAMVLQLSTVGFGVVWFPSALWFIYRIVHGWLLLNDGDRV
jgi:uncharacterized membrane protein